MSAVGEIARAHVRTKPDERADTDVLIAGAGPVGLTLAIDLGRRGVRCTLIERNPTTAPYPKMDRSNARTMELYRRIGIVDRVRALGYPPENSMDVYLCTRLSDPPIAVLEYPSVAERRKQIAESEDGALAARALPAGVAEQARAAAQGGGGSDAQRHRPLRLRADGFRAGRRRRDRVGAHRRRPRRDAARGLPGRAATAAAAGCARSSASSSRAAAASATWCRSSSSRTSSTGASAPATAGTTISSMPRARPSSPRAAAPSSPCIRRCRPTPISGR